MASTTSPRGRWVSRVENPFSFKVAQVFTGFGVGCGVGIGVGRPIYLGAIPALQQVMTATRGATDAFSGIGRHVNGSLKKLGLKNIEAGVGCGIGLGHGFGVGIALKPGVVHGIQSSVGEVMNKIMRNLENVPGLSSASNLISGSLPGSITTHGGSATENMQTSSHSSVELESEAARISLQQTTGGENSIPEIKKNGLTSRKSIESHREKVLTNVLQNPILQNDTGTNLSEMTGKLGDLNNVLQMLLKHQQVIEELMEENQQLRHILVEDLNIPPIKLQPNRAGRIKAYYPCSDCFECRRRTRKAAR
ncbi:uncharacterized protein [Typha latifolia]|uniref:uncharacterized protein n=1 Tax=Typha latifolia TaxID=4733 RepID=UPI003C2CD9BA